MAQRDYYADLELPKTADIQEIKKQFRKLALKYHPDRNPGQAVDVNARFQIIQAANEVLSDPQQKAKYDATYERSASSRFAAASGTASGVRGNPWQNVGQQFPTPPRRNPQPQQHPMSGAKRWHDRFSYGVPPTAKQKASAEPSTKASAAHAFESMRGGGYQQAGSKSSGQYQQQERPVPPRPSSAPRPPPPPPPPPPRTETAKKKAEASFGTRKMGYAPHSGLGDEPPVTNHNYSTRINTERPVPIPDPLSQFRDKDEADDEGEGEVGGEDAQDARQRTPYTRMGGERTNPFDGTPLSRPKSSRESSRRDEPTESPHKSDTMHRKSSSSSSATKSETKERSRPVSAPQSTEENPFNRRKARMKTRSATKSNASDTSNSTSTTNGQAPIQQPSRPSMTRQKSSPKKPVNGTDGPSMYASYDDFLFSNHRIHSSQPFNHTQASHAVPQYTFSTNLGNTCNIKEIPSGISNPILTSFEKQQSDLLRHLIQNQRNGTHFMKEPRRETGPIQVTATTGDLADTSFSSSFSIPLDGDHVDASSPEPSQYHKASVEDINTNFVNDENVAAWQFSAGSANGSQFPSRSQPGSRAGSRLGRRPPNKRPVFQKLDIPSNSPLPSSTQSSAGFDAENWANKFGPQTFMPQTAGSTATSPTRRINCSNSRKIRPVKPMVDNVNGTAAHESGDSDEDPLNWPGRKPAQPKYPAPFVTPDSPQAMDIDPPQVPSEEPRPKMSPTTARNIPVEPSRPEWRSGDVGPITPEPEPSGQEKEKEKKAQVPVSVNHLGSEDTEDFKTKLADLSMVTPLADMPTGLKSFSDLRDNLPFESKASNEAPIKIPHAHPLLFPSPPVAPRPPVGMSLDGVKPNVATWSKYLEEFVSYLRLWDIFNAQVVDHFTTRKTNISRARNERGYTFLGSRGDSDVVEYHNWIEQDNDVMRKWQAALEEHNIRFREYMAFRERMK